MEILALLKRFLVKNLKRNSNIAEDFKINAKNIDLHNQLYN